MTTLTIRSSGPLHGEISVPGDKSISHRALLLSAIAEGHSHITNFLESEDCRATVRIMRALGVSVQSEGSGELLVEGKGLHGLKEASAVLDCGGSGTTMRLLAGLLAGQPFFSILGANAALSRRPMERIAAPLRLMGATVLGREWGKLPPLAIAGRGLHGISYVTSVASAQVKSGILLAGIFADSPTTVREPLPSRDHSERMLRALGVTVRSQDTTITIDPPSAPLPAFELGIPADISSAAFPIVAACLVAGSAITVRNVGVNPTRTGLLDVLARMKAAIEIEAQPDSGSEPVAHIHVRASELQATDIGVPEIPRLIDELPIIAIAATQAHGVTTVHDAAELRVKESDRIAALAMELRKMGAQIEELPDGFAIAGPTPLTGAAVDAHSDHRLAMSFAVAGLIARGETLIAGAESIDDSYPGFEQALAALGAHR